MRVESLRVRSLGFLVSGVGLGVWGLEFGFWGLAVRFWGLRFENLNHPLFPPAFRMSCAVTDT